MMSEVRANIWLFHVAAQLSRTGFQIKFVAAKEKLLLTFLPTEGTLRSSSRQIPAARCGAKLRALKMPYVMEGTPNQRKAA